MTENPQYRRKLQRLAEFLVAALPPRWSQGSVQVTFRSEIATDLELRYRESPSVAEQHMRVPSEILRDFVKAARGVRAELERAGNPECGGFLFRLEKDGSSSLDVQY